MNVRAKKSLGQHFLRDENIARKIVDSLNTIKGNVVEVGPGKGVLTKFLLEKENLDCRFVETDREAFDYLIQNFPENKESFILGNFLKTDLAAIFNEPFTIIGNFPYNISSQIFFKTLENRNLVSEVVCMIQKEVAERIASPKGKKQYGILSVLLQAYYSIEYLFTVNEQVFDPPPKVKSAVIRLTRNDVTKLDCDEKLFFAVVKSGFNYRRKILRNALKGLVQAKEVLTDDIFNKRAEQLGVPEFVELTRMIQTYT